jgi:hypothetical protein
MHARHGRVLVAARSNVVAYELLETLGGLKIGESLGEIDGPVLLREPGHYRENGRTGVRQLASDGLH